MVSPQHFVVASGDPALDGDPVESGVYRAGAGYPAFSATPGNLLLLYCTDNYDEYRKTVPGIGVVVRAGRNAIEYRWIQIPVPVAKETLDEYSAPEDRKKMKELSFNARRVF
jgi:hypothetical protein